MITVLVVGVFWFLALIGALLPFAAVYRLFAYRKCSFCREQMKSSASVCPHCGRERRPKKPAENIGSFKELAAVSLGVLLLGCVVLSVVILLLPRQ